jgi:hypothetical protein
MRWLKWGLVGVLLVAAVVVFSTKIFQKKYTYYYYPQWNAYYDVRNKNYIYSIDGGKSWDTISNSSNTIASTLGEKIVLRSNSNQIWMDNEEHRSRYGGTLNDFVGNFLKTGEEQKEGKKKRSINDSSQYNIKKDSLTKDSLEEIDNWVKGAPTQEHSAKETGQAKEEVTPAVNETDLENDTTTFENE